MVRTWPCMSDASTLRRDSPTFWKRPTELLPNVLTGILPLPGMALSRSWLLEQIANEPRLQQRIQWLGPCDNIPGLLKTASVLVHASLWEGMPNAVLEAMAARLPVIGTAIEGTEDLVIPGQTGWLVPPGDSEALSGALLEAAESPDRCVRYGEARPSPRRKGILAGQNRRSL